MLTLLLYLAGILLTIFFVIGIHECGHFIAARLMGVKVLRFSIGFGKALYRRYDKKGTEYIFAAIPLGGYVQMLDENEEPVAKDQLHLAYNRQPFYKKFIIVAAGPLSNILFAFLLYWSLFIIGFTSVLPVTGEISPHSIAANAGIKPQQQIISVDNTATTSWMSVIIRILSHSGNQDQLAMSTKSMTAAAMPQKHLLDLTHWRMNDLKPDPLESLGIMPYVPNIPAVIGSIVKDSPAAKSPLKIGDKILAVNNKRVSNWLGFITEIDIHPNQTLALTLQRQGKTQTIDVPISYQRDLLFKKHGYLGVAPQFHWPKNLLRENKYDPFTALSHAWQNTYDFAYLNLMMFGKLIMGKVSLQSLGGPIAIFQGAGLTLSEGITPFMSFLAFLSIAIGMINILPIPGLDGGHMLFQIIESVTRRPIAPRILILSYRLGLIVLVLLIIQAITNDILRL